MTPRRPCLQVDANGQVNSSSSFGGFLGAAIDLELLDFLFPMAGGSAEALTMDLAPAGDEASLQQARGRSGCNGQRWFATQRRHIYMDWRGTVASDSTCVRSTLPESKSDAAMLVFFKMPIPRRH
jgi:hypothetical protein